MSDSSSPHVSPIPPSPQSLSRKSRQSALHQQKVRRELIDAAADDPIVFHKDAPIYAQDSNDDW